MEIEGEKIGRSSEVGERRVFEQVKEMCVLDHVKALGLCVCLALAFHSPHFGIIFCHCYFTYVSQAVMQVTTKLYQTAQVVFLQAKCYQITLLGVSLCENIL